MRSALLCVLALSIATPAMAAHPSESSRDVQAMADKLNDPRTQNAMAGAISAMLDAVLDIRVDGMAKALEPLNKGRKIDTHGRTVREMAEREDPHFEDMMEDRTRAGVAGMGALASALAVMLPQLEEAARKMGDALPNSH
jgi:hypothetical protein